MRFDIVSWPKDKMSVRFDLSGTTYNVDKMSDPIDPDDVQLLREVRDLLANAADKIALRLGDSIQTPAAIPEVVEALKRIANCTDAPDIDATGEWQQGLHCGVEDRDCQNRYDGADYGHTVGVEKALEWASNEAKYALAKLEEGGEGSHRNNNALR